MSVPPPPLDLTLPGRYHVVGVGGPGMSAIALVLAGMGHRVSGSDLNESPVLDRLRAAGVSVHIGHDPALGRAVDAVTASTAIPPDNVELVAAAEAGATVLTRAGMLASICACARSLGIAGTHGKTTTTSMLTVVLDEAGRDPSFVVGGDVSELGTGARWTGSDWLVVEADESDRTHLELPLAGTVLTNVETDHLDHYGTFDDIVAGFDRYLAGIDGPKVVCADDPVAAELGRRHDAVTYGTGPTARYRAVDAVSDRGTLHFGVQRDGEPFGALDVPLRGLHNVRNVTAVVALADLVGVPFEVTARALARFGGVRRRFDVRGRRDGITLVDDYAHLPTEIAAVLEAAATSGDEWQRIVSVFQPNRFNRMAIMSPDYRDAFVHADVAVVTDVYASGTTPIEGVTGKLVVDAVCDAHPGQRVVWLRERAELVSFLARELRAGDVCISMGCGDVERLPDEILAVWDAGDGWAMSTPEERRSSIEGAALMLGPLARREVPLGPLTTYRVGGPVALMVHAESVDDVARLGAAATEHDLPVIVVGRGSNLLVADAGFAGVALVLGAFATAMSVEARPTGADVVAGGALSLPVLARQTVAAGLTGLEWAVGVPGSVGGGVRMNAGGHGSDIAATLEGVRVFDLRGGEHGGVAASALALRFRGSDLGEHQVVLSARFRLDHGDRERSEQELAEIVRWRRDHQPGGQNAGSVFVNPVPGEVSAGELIDRLGLRGLRVGSAEVSMKHANFIQADAGGRADDVRALMAEVRRRVLAATGFALRSEIRQIGFEDVDDGVRDREPAS